MSEKLRHPRAPSIWQVSDKGLATWSGAGLALILSVLLSWPMLLTSGPLIYFDTSTYYGDGAQMAAYIQRAFAEFFPATPEPGGGGTGTSDGAASEGVKLRSVAYSLFFFVSAQSALGLLLTTVLQTAITLWTLLALIPPGSRFDMPQLALGGLFVTVTTTLPWFAAYAMPDILGAAVLLVYAIALRRLDSLPIGAVIVLILVGAFAVASHYGHFPLAAALACLVLLWRLIGRRLTVLSFAVCLLPIVIPAGANFTTSQAALDEGSIAPKRLPILLARSLADGPAAWYLNEACPEAGYAMCELFDVMPENVGVFLWTEDGLAGATPAQLDRIRDEEIPVLLAAFRAYPVAQLRSLFGNAMLQIVRVGTGQLIPQDATDEDGHLRTELAQSDPVIAAFDRITLVATGLAAIVLLMAMVIAPPTRVWREAVWVVLFGLLANAGVFGGLSAPVDRYQSRIVWLLPVLLVLILTCRDARHRNAGRAPASLDPVRGRFGV